jgi:hypothetical protein
VLLSFIAVYLRPHIFIYAHIPRNVAHRSTKEILDLDLLLGACARAARHVHVLLSREDSLLVVS